MGRDLPTVRTEGLVSDALEHVRRACADDFRIAADAGGPTPEVAPAAAIRRVETWRERSSDRAERRLLVQVEGPSSTGWLASGPPSRVSAVVDLAVATDRLALLALLSTFLPERRTVGASERSFLCPENIQVPLLWRVALIQTRLSLHTNEATLAGRIGIRPWTLRRWFRGVSGIAPSRFLQWVRILVVAEQVHRTRLSPSRVVELLGFEQPDSFRRCLLQVTGCTLHDLRAESTRDELLATYRIAAVIG